MTPAQRTVIVVAGNRRQFENYCRERDVPLNTPGIKYISRAHQVFGLANFEVVKVGTWYENNEYDDGFWDYINRRQMKAKQP